jgi:hypothetical protein
MPLIVPTSTIAAGGYTNYGGTGSLHAALADEDEDTGVLSPDSPSGATMKLGLSDPGVPLAGAVYFWIDAIQAPPP